MSALFLSLPLGETPCDNPEWAEKNLGLNRKILVHHRGEGGPGHLVHSQARNRRREPAVENSEVDAVGVPGNWTISSRSIQ